METVRSATDQEIFEAKTDNVSWRTVGKKFGLSEGKAVYRATRYCMAAGITVGHGRVHDLKRMAEGRENLRMQRAQPKKDAILANPPPGRSALDKKRTEEAQAKPSDPFALVVRTRAVSQAEAAYL